MDEIAKAGEIQLITEDKRIIDYLSSQVGNTEPIDLFDREWFVTGYDAATSFLGYVYHFKLLEVIRLQEGTTSDVS